MSTTTEATTIRDIRHVYKNITTAESLESVCDALLECGWDLKDPAGRMFKTPDEIREFLASFSTRSATYAELKASRAGGLFKMIIDAYERALKAATSADLPY